MNFTYAPTDSDLASRTSAAKLRAIFEEQLVESSATLDLSNVESVSESYADEFFGVLVEHYSLPWVFSRLNVVSARPPVIRSIRTAIRYRLEVNQRVPPEEILCSAKVAVAKHEEAFA